MQNSNFQSSPLRLDKDKMATARQPVVTLDYGRINRRSENNNNNNNRTDKLSTDGVGSTDNVGFTDTCLIELPLGLSDEQKKWYCQFQRLFKNSATDHVDFLKSCRCYDEKQWKENLRHALHKALNHGCTAYEDAWQKIQTAADRGLESLVFRYLVLSRVPTNIGRCTLLKTLVLQEVDVHQLPSDMKRLTNLETLSIAKCPLYDLPEWIGDLRKLKKLVIARCRLRNIPSSLVRCDRLTELDLKYNFLSFESFLLPRPTASSSSRDLRQEDDGKRESVLRFANLERLDVEGNSIAFRWTEMRFDLPKLISLNLNQTLTTELPESISTKLVVLSWSGVANLQTRPRFSNRIRYLNMSGSSFAKSATVVGGLKSNVEKRSTEESRKENKLWLETLSMFPHLEYVNVPGDRDSVSEQHRKKFHRQGTRFITCRPTVT